MDVKTRNLLIIAAGIIFLIIGTFNVTTTTSMWSWVTLVIGIILIVLGAVGLKQGRVIG
jgi:hypothetical protein